MSGLRLSPPGDGAVHPLALLRPMLLALVLSPFAARGEHPELVMRSLFELWRAERRRRRWKVAPSSDISTECAEEAKPSVPPESKTMAGLSWIQELGVSPPPSNGWVPRSSKNRDPNHEDVATKSEWWGTTATSDWIYHQGDSVYFHVPTSSLWERREMFCCDPEVDNYTFYRVDAVHLKALSLFAASLDSSLVPMAWAAWVNFLKKRRSSKLLQTQQAFKDEIVVTKGPMEKRRSFNASPAMVEAMRAAGTAEAAASKAEREEEALRTEPEAEAAPAKEAEAAVAAEKVDSGTAKIATSVDNSRLKGLGALRIPSADSDGGFAAAVGGAVLPSAVALATCATTPRSIEPSTAATVGGSSAGSRPAAKLRLQPSNSSMSFRSSMTSTAALSFGSRGWSPLPTIAANRGGKKMGTNGCLCFGGKGRAKSGHWKVDATSAVDVANSSANTVTTPPSSTFAPSEPHSNKTGGTGKQDSPPVKSTTAHDGAGQRTTMDLVVAAVATVGEVTQPTVDATDRHLRRLDRFLSDVKKNPQRLSNHVERRRAEKTTGAFSVG
eukprot:TRINITY_DN36227_c0_g1_i2.p1 TRINITY_DN36227_c0_g1~~TRINITY_DN36227_c0_g1_i2.p1  ORF type:complete len:554 (-),score=93.88 TRINITY_DN36227_c0_g1_i2:284-1945(-)